MKKPTAFLSLVALSAFLAAPLASGATPTAHPPNEALQSLKDGNTRFVTGKPTSCMNVPESRARLEKFQAPEAVVLSCSDSRVPPEKVFDQGLGKIFTVRVAGNIVNEDEIASIEYAVTELGSHLIVVLGHDACGAIKSAVTTPPGKDTGSPNLNHLLTQIRGNLGISAPSGGQSAAAIADPNLREPVKRNVSAVAQELTRRSKILRDAVASGNVKIVEGVYELSTGKVLWN